MSTRNNNPKNNISPMEGNWMQDVENDWHKCKSIMQRQHILFRNLLVTVNTGDRKGAVAIAEDLILGHKMLQELWGIESPEVTL